MFFAALPVTNELPLHFRVEVAATPAAPSVEECVACNLGPVYEDGECIDCDVNPADRDESKSMLSVDERA